ncbi:MAG: anthranilate phosphoribosyltransferase [Clostridiales bacterium]|nr:anthranilate phosphoribosyltransferase [Clostridiales bacterium]
MIQEAIKDVVNGKNLNFDAAAAVMDEIMDGAATQAQIGAFLTAMRMKGETIEEITACAAAMRKKGIKINPVRPVMDIVGTGGDGAGTFNISTTSSFVAAAGGIPIAKHGNRGVSSRSGAADVLERVGVKIDLTAEQNEVVLSRCGLCFMFAPVYHSSMKYAAPVRKDIGIRTIFNILGPLVNPAGASMQLLGVYDPNLVEPLAQVLSNLGVVRGLVVCGNGLEEASLAGVNKICEIRSGNLTVYELSASDVGMAACRLEDILGGTPEENAAITRGILDGTIKGPKRDIVVLNSALALYLGIDGADIPKCIELAEKIIDSGNAKSKLDEFAALTNEV